MPTTFPINKALEDAQSMDASSPKPTLLVVDDEEGPRQSLRVVFKDDYNVLLAENGSRALEFARQNKIDAAVLDIRMSGMTGIELLERLKAIDPGIEVIMLTAYETIDTMRQALRFGACDYINKPFDLNSMRVAVASAMERRSLTEEIRNNNEKLAALQVELQSQRLQEEITRTRGEIYASIIHDINGPLTIISGFIQIINQKIGAANKVEGEDLDMVKDRLKRITRQVSNCIEISKRYLSFMRQASAEKTRVSANQILKDLEELLKVHPCTQNHQLRIELLPQDLVLQINGTDLIQILLNLAINAFQSTPQPHFVEISGKVIPQPIDFSQFPDLPTERLINREALKNIPPLLQLSVRDNGPGIPQELIAKIFEPYFTTKAEGRGTGLGLSIVQRLIKEGNGCLHLHSQTGQGTVFNLFLPASMGS